MRILTVNTGSSSVRLALIEHRAVGHVVVNARARLDAGRETPDCQLRAFLADHPPVEAVAHRVVHGGEHLVMPARLEPPVRAEIERMAVFAPLHNPRALSWIRACDAVFGPAIPQVAVFDTAFFADLPDVARMYALPRDVCELHAIRRYGFHGLAHQAMWQRWHAGLARQRNRNRIISLQLGSGCSITAIADGRPLDTSMGFTPLEGLVMATRCGDLDPGVVTYLLRASIYTAEELESVLSNRSGLLGVSGTSADMRTLLASPETAARLAVDLYCYRARRYIGAYLAVLGGADAILFGGGVGENAPEVRARILAGLEWAGIKLDAARNNTAIGREASISQAGQGVDVQVIAVDEARTLADASMSILAAKGGTP